jgi:hypothetical protein
MVPTNLRLSGDIFAYQKPKFVIPFFEGLEMKFLNILWPSGIFKLFGAFYFHLVCFVVLLYQEKCMYYGRKHFKNHNINPRHVWCGPQPSF